MFHVKHRNRVLAKAGPKEDVMNYRSITLIGHVGSDPEIKLLDSGSKVAQFSIAVGEKWGSGDQVKTSTTWFRVEIWQPKGGSMIDNFAGRYIHKGSLLFVQGIPHTETYTAADGSKRASFKVRIAGPNTTIRLLDKRGNGATESAGETASTGSAAGTPPDDGSLDGLDDKVPF